MKNLPNTTHLIIIYLLTVVSLFISRIECASSPLINVRDINMGGYQVGFRFNAGFGPGNTSNTFGHAPDINPTSVNYKLLISTSYNADYTISSNTISISVQIIAKNQTHFQASLYSSYVQSLIGIYIYTDVLVIDETSPSYPYILPSILILNGLTLMSTSYDQLVDVSTFSPSNLNLNNNLVIYSFLIGFQIISQNNDFQLTVSSQIINETKIKVTISSIVNLISVDLVKIDTVVIDKTAITFSKLLVLDFQTVDCPTDPCIINYAYPSYLDNIQNKFTGLSSFYLINKAHFFFDTIANPTNIVINLSAAYNFTRIVFTNLFFVMKQCPVGFPFFHKPSQLCFTFSCSSDSYLFVSLQQCLPCLYQCLTCQYGVNCTSCNSSEFRILDSNNSMCIPIDGYYDDGTNNSIAQQCNFPCGNCFGNANNCTSCINSAFFLHNSTNITICQQICGDGILYNLECDDGNLISGDGCSSSCQIELFYSCSGGSSTSHSVCIFNGNIEITTISFLKDETKNTIYLKFQVNKNINISNLNLNEMFLPNFPYQDIQTIYDASSDNYLCTINYDKPLNSYDSLTLTFRFPTNSNFSSSLNFTITLNSQTDNNLALKYYSPHMYSQLKSLTDSSEILIYLYTAVCLIAWVAGQQLYSLQLFFVLQYAYLGLLTLDRLQFSMISLKQFAPSFGLCDINNLIKESNEFSISPKNPLPIKIKSLGFSESLLFNINLSFAILLSMFLVGLLIYFIGTTLELMRWKIQGKKIFVWWVFYWLIIIQIPAFTDIFISFKYQKQSFQNFRADFLISFLYLILFVCIIIYLIIFKNTSQSTKIINLNNQSLQEISSNTQNKQILEEKNYTSAKLIQTYFSLLSQEQIKNDRLSCFLKNNFYLCVMIYRALLVLAVIFQNDYISHQVGFNVLCLILDLLMLLYISIVRPYKFNFRPIFNSSIILVLEAFYTYKKIINKQSDVSVFSFEVVVIIIALLYLTLIINIYFIAKKIFQNCVNYFEVQEQKRKVEINQTDNENLQDHINYQREQKNQTKDFINFQHKQQPSYFEKLQFQFQGQNKNGQEKIGQDKNVHQKTRQSRSRSHNLSQIYLKKEQIQVDQIINNKKDQENIRTIKIQPKSNISYSHQRSQGFQTKNKNLDESNINICNSDINSNIHNNDKNSNIHNSDINFNSEDLFFKQQKLIFASSDKNKTQEFRFEVPLQQSKTSLKRRKNKKKAKNLKNQEQYLKDNEQLYIFYI